VVGRGGSGYSPVCAEDTRGEVCPSERCDGILNTSKARAPEGGIGMYIGGGLLVLILIIILLILIF
jgi:predicted nucleic acid-binding Zn ribbon protein